MPNQGYHDVFHAVAWMRENMPHGPYREFDKGRVYEMACAYQDTFNRPASEWRDIHASARQAFAQGPVTKTKARAKRR